MTLVQASDELVQEHETLTQFVYMAPVGLLQARADGEIVMINPVAAQLLMPLSPDGELSNLFTALQGIAPDLRHRLDNFQASQGLICDGVQMPVRPDPGSAAGLRVLSLSLVKLEKNLVMAMLQDVTSQARREHLLRQQEAWLHAMLSGVSGYALVGLDLEGRVVGWNEGVGRLTGFTAEAIVGRPFSTFYPRDAITTERVLDRLAEADSGGWSLDDGWRLRADGSRYWGSSLIAPLRLTDARVAPAALPGMPVEAESSYYLILRDMSEQREAAEQARKAAVCDHLTGIGNRRAFFEAAETEVRRMQKRARPLSLVLFDADHFKKINDSHGHPVGDRVLCHIAATLVAAFRPVDVVARIGGEEFAVLLPSTDIAGAQAAAQRACRLLAGSPALTDVGPLACTVSAGVATMTDGGESLDDVLKRADKALYAAKAAGRNTVRSQADADAPPEVAKAA